MHKDTPPSSPRINENMQADDMVYVGDVDEVIETYDQEALEDEIDNDASKEVDVATLHVFRGHTSGSVFCGSLNKTGTLAATGGEDDRAYLWDTTTGKILLKCTGHGDSIIYVKLSNDETYVATIDMRGLIQIWKLPECEVITDMSNNYFIGDATWMEWYNSPDDPDANILLAGGTEGHLCMWDIPEGTRREFKGNGSSLETAVVFPDGKRIAIGYGDGTIKVVELATRNALITIPPRQGHATDIIALDCHNDNNLILSASTDITTILSTSNTGKVLHTFHQLEKDSTSVPDDESGYIGCNSAKNWIEALAFCSDPTFQVAATGTIKGEIFIWDISKKVLRHKMKQESGMSKLLWKGNTSLLFSAGLDGNLRCFDAKSAQCIRVFTGHTAGILDVVISANCERALTTSDDGTARVFDITLS